MKKIALHPHPYHHNSHSHHQSIFSDETVSHDAIRHSAKSKHAVQLANTYKLGPEKDAIFQQETVKHVMEDILQTKINDMAYDGDKCKFLAMELATEIKHRVKLLGFDRYKLVSQVTINSLHGQGMRMASRFIWDERFDNYVSCTYRTPTMCVIAVIFGVYQE
eukprot:gene7898-8751_t